MTDDKRMEEVRERIVGLEKIPANEQFLGHFMAATQRILLDLHDEIRALWPKLDGVGLIWSSILKVMAFTGQRGDEVRNMRWEDVEGSWWTQATNKADRVHRVFLVPTVRAVLDEIGPQREGLVFESRKGIARKSIPNKVLRDLRGASGITDFKPHQLRHTAETEMSMIGVTEEHRRKVLNHAEGGMTRIYGHYDFDREKRAALSRLERHLLVIIEGREAGKVVSIKGER